MHQLAWSLNCVYILIINQIKLLCTMKHVTKPFSCFCFTYYEKRNLKMLMYIFISIPFYFFVILTSAKSFRTIILRHTSQTWDSFKITVSYASQTHFFDICVSIRSEMSNWQVWNSKLTSFKKNGYIKRIIMWIFF